MGRGKIDIGKWKDKDLCYSVSLGKVITLWDFGKQTKGSKVYSFRVENRNVSRVCWLEQASLIWFFKERDEFKKELADSQAELEKHTEQKWGALTLANVKADCF